MRRCLLRRQSERFSPGSRRFSKLLTQCRIKRHFPRHLSTHCGARCNSLASKIVRLLSESHAAVLRSIWAELTMPSRTIGSRLVDEHTAERSPAPLGRSGEDLVQESAEPANARRAVSMTRGPSTPAARHPAGVLCYTAPPDDHPLPLHTLRRSPEHSRAACPLQRSQQQEGLRYASTGCDVFPTPMTLVPPGKGFARTQRGRSPRTLCQRR